MHVPVKPDFSRIREELLFQVSRSSGPGGQNVNKVNTKVSVKLDVLNSGVLNEEQKDWILKKLANRVTGQGILILSSQDARSQLQNKETAISKLELLLEGAFKPRKARKATRPGAAAVRKRIQDKKRRSEKKEWRRGVK